MIPWRGTKGSAAEDVLRTLSEVSVELPFADSCKNVVLGPPWSAWMHQKASFLAEKLALFNAVMATLGGDPWGLIPRGLAGSVRPAGERKGPILAGLSLGDLARRGRAHPRRSNNRQVAQIS